MSTDEQPDSDPTTADTPVEDEPDGGDDEPADGDDESSAVGEGDGGDDGPDSRKSRRAAAVLAIVLGGIGGHKFYLGRVEQGLVYLCLAWTLLPALAGVLEGIRYLRQSDEAFQRQYGD
ncbi:TM2 domain-containing protein [Haloarcula sp. GH36]|uniref:TM2 domain-containing protein n=1 Tax=Haloarcula montana TaxID=3111776 RepID=UPI002D78CDE5|nr:TM2 domain-containing protein [Haloarcula sp. GH36]